MRRVLNWTWLMKDGEKKMTYQDMKNSLMMLEEPVEKLELVMDFGKMLEQIPIGADCNEIVGCSSFVQICRKDGRFFASADSAIVRGIVALFLAMVDGKNYLEIKSMDLESEFNSLNLNLGASRLNGVNSMIRFFKNL